MGLLDSLFGSKTENIPDPVILETPWGPINRAVIQDAISNEFGGLSANEQTGQSILASILRGESFQDPRNSPLYKGLRDESQAEESTAVDKLRRRQQLSGAFNSSHGLRGEADLRNRASNQRQTLLGGLFEQERARDNPYTRLQAANQYGGAARNVAGQRAGLAQGLLNYQPFHQRQQISSPSIFSQVAGPLGGLLGGLGGLGGLFGGSAGAGGLGGLGGLANTNRSNTNKTPSRNSFGLGSFGR